MNPLAKSLNLSDTQARIIIEMQPGEWHDAYKLCRQFRTRSKLKSYGFTEPKQVGPVTQYWLIRLTEKGVAARTVLIEYEATKDLPFRATK